MQIKVKFHTEPYDLVKIGGSKSDWIDLRTAGDVEMRIFDYKLISLGVSMELPEGCEALVVPRSSLFRNYGIIQANGVGVIDESYCGDSDVWHFPAVALREYVHIPKGTRICQFRIIRHQPEIEFDVVQSLGNENRGGIGSTGID